MIFWADLFQKLRKLSPLSRVYVFALSFMATIGLLLLIRSRFAGGTGLGLFLGLAVAIATGLEALERFIRRRNSN